MDTTQFLQRVLPSQGYYFLVTKTPKGFIHKAFTDIGDMSHSCESKKNIFFALAGYKQPEYVDENGAKHWREASNTQSVRSFWIDIDCGVQYEGSQLLAATDLDRFCGESGIPQPNVLVNSGNGLHAYWTLSQDISIELWSKIAAMFKAVTRHFQFATDDKSRTSDIASILRPIGTFNDKTDKGLGIKPVELWRDVSDTLNAREFLQAVKDVYVSLGLTARTSASKAKIGKDSPLYALIGGTEYKESSATLIADQCAQIREFRDTRGEHQSEPLWRGCLSVVKHCTDGEELAHEWSSGHPGYNREATQDKLDAIAGPYMCDTFKDINEAGCAGCQHNCGSPIHLGYPTPEVITQVVYDEPDADGELVELLPEIPQGLRRKVRFDPEKGTFLFAKSPDGAFEWVNITGLIVKPEGYFMDEQDGFSYKMKMAVRMGRNKWVSATVSAKSICAGKQTLAAEMGAKALIVTHRPDLLERYMKVWVEELQKSGDEISMHEHMGWQPDRSFVCGDMKYLPDGTSKRVILSEELRKFVKKLRFDVVGDPARYTELINKAYNRPNHEAYQFMYIAGYASMLVALMEPGTLGLLVSGWSADSGYGKSTVTKMAVGAFHSPSEVIDANGTTPLALSINAGMRHNLPMVVDELTQWPTEKSADFAYNYTNGKGKEQAAAAGGLRDNSKYNWSNMCLCTGNRSQHENIKMHHQNCGAQLARVFEFEFITPHTETLSAAEGREVFIELSAMRGVYRDAYCAYVAEHQNEIANELQRTFGAFMSKAGLEKDARFWVIAASCVWVALNITQKLGVHNFDRGNLLQWILNQLRQHSSSTKVSKVDYVSVFGDALNELQSGFITTMNYGSKHERARLAPGWSMPKGPVTGRQVLDDDTLFLSVTALSNWCRVHNVDKTQMVKRLKSSCGLTDTRVVRLSANTQLVAPAVRTYVFDTRMFKGVLEIVPDQPEEEIEA